MCETHLDNVVYGAGINDDGSGSISILAVAQTLVLLVRDLSALNFVLRWSCSRRGHHSRKSELCEQSATCVVRCRRNWLAEFDNRWMIVLSLD